MIDFSSKNRSFFIKKRPFLGQFFIEKHSQFSSKIDQNGFELCRLKFSTYLHSKFIKFGCFWSIFVQKIDFEIFVRRHRLRTTREKNFFFFLFMRSHRLRPVCKELSTQVIFRPRNHRFGLIFVKYIGNVAIYEFDMWQPCQGLHTLVLCMPIFWAVGQYCLGNACNYLGYIGSFPFPVFQV
jgi:hypothetical protein